MFDPQNKLYQIGNYITIHFSNYDNCYVSDLTKLIKAGVRATIFDENKNIIIVFNRKIIWRVEHKCACLYTEISPRHTSICRHTNVVGDHTQYFERPRQFLNEIAHNLCGSKNQIHCSKTNVQLKKEKNLKNIIIL